MNPYLLPRAARRILDCINQFFVVYYWKTTIYPNLPRQPELGGAYSALENAAVESSLIALRAFDDFVRRFTKKTDDLKVSDFSEMSIGSLVMESHDRENINKKIAHLTQLDSDQYNHAYPYRNLFSRLLPEAIIFCEYVVAHLPNQHDLHQFAADT